MKPVNESSSELANGRRRARPMTVGKLSRSTGVPIKTLCAYTGPGLIYTLGRSPAGYRLFDAEALWCVHWIGELRALGLIIAEIRELVTAEPGDGAPAGPRLAQLLERSRWRLHHRIVVQQQMLGCVHRCGVRASADQKHGAD